MKQLIVSLVLYLSYAIVQAQSCALTDERIEGQENTILFELLGPSGQIDFGDHEVRISQGESCSDWHSIGNLQCRNCLNQGEATSDIIFNSPKNYQLRQADRLSRFRQMQCPRVKREYHACATAFYRDQAEMNRSERQMRSQFREDFHSTQIAFGRFTRRRMINANNFADQRMSEERERIRTQRQNCEQEHEQAFSQCEQLGIPREIYFDFSDNQHMMCRQGLVSNFYEYTLKDLANRRFRRRNHDVSMLRANRCPGTSQNPQVVDEESLSGETSVGPSAE
jgi:hypothetical protein